MKKTELNKQKKSCRMSSNFKIAHSHIESIVPLIKKEAAGCFVHPYLSVTFGTAYSNYIFSWDNHHMSLRFAAAGETEQMRYFLENMLSFQASNGYVPSIISLHDGTKCAIQDFHAQPFLAQNAAIYTNLSPDKKWVSGIFPKLKAYIAYWLEKHAAPLGLFRWRYPYMSGIDNEIFSTIMLPDTIITPDLPAWLYLELLSMAELAKFLGDIKTANDYLRKAEAIKKAINDHLWNETLGTYASYDLCAGRCRVSLEREEDEGMGRYAFLSCPVLIPLFAGIAPTDRATRMIKNYVLSPDHFRSSYGIRSLSRSSEYYNNAAWGNPPRFGEHRRMTNSNWQGPVWIPINWFVFHALLNYGFEEDAESLAEDTFKVIARSVKKWGFMRENFHGETGEPLYADNFASWNILADLMPEYLSGGKKPFSVYAFERSMQKFI